VGGQPSNPAVAATSLADRGRRHFLEQEGLNAWGVWGFTQWPLLAQHIRKGFEYAKQRCTAYPRFVVQRRLLAAFLETYLPVLRDLRFGHPLAVESPHDPLPELDFGPVISSRKAAELTGHFRRGAGRASAAAAAAPRLARRRTFPARAGRRRLRGPRERPGARCAGVAAAR